MDDDSYFLTVLRYIHQNPLKAGIVKDIARYGWSSYSEYTGNGKMVDTDFTLKLFNDRREKAIPRFKDFHQIMSNDICLDMDETRRILDAEATRIIKEICMVGQCTDVQKMEKDKRDRLLKVLKDEGLSTRQLARLTGISRGIILKA